MKKSEKNVIAERDGWLIRLAEDSDLKDYYQQNFCPLDPETARMTGSKTEYSEEEVTTFFRLALLDEDREFFLLVSPEGRIAGEAMINEIDWDLRKANFRIGLFDPASKGQGLGSWLTGVVRDYAFEVLKLHRLELDVFSFNPAARRVYEKAGFRVEGVLRDAIFDGDDYADEILMSILEGEWKELKEAEGCMRKCKNG